MTTCHIFVILLIHWTWTIQVSLSYSSEIKVLSINVAGKSVYDESPPEEGQDDVFDFDKVYGDYLKHLSQYPNANFTEILQSAEDGGGFVTWILNPDLYKKARIEQICKVINSFDYTAVFLREVWFIRDYQRIVQCAKNHYFISAFDQECKASGDQSLIGCSGLVTLVTRTPCSNAFILDQVFTALPKGSQADAAKLSKDELLIYADYILGRKALVTDVKIFGRFLRLVNLHLATFDSFGSNIETNRDLRVKQAQYFCSHISRQRFSSWEYQIVSIDMNDVPWKEPPKLLAGEDGECCQVTQGGETNKVYQTFLDYGFISAFNPNQGPGFEYEPTYHAESNTWGEWEQFFASQSINEFALDHVFIKAKEGKSFSFDYTEIKDFQAPIQIHDGQTEQISISDHNSVSVGIKLLF